MMRGFCPRGFCPEGAYVLMELCMEGVLSKGVLSEGVLSYLPHLRGQCTRSNAEALLLLFLLLNFSISKHCSAILLSCALVIPCVNFL